MSINDEIPRSRLTMTYCTEVDGKLEDVTLPLRLFILGDFSKGSSRDAQVDLDARPVRNLDGTNLPDVMADMDLSVKMSVPNRIDPENSENLEIDLAIESMKSFSPAAVAEQVPKVRSLLLLKRLLLELQANMDNSKEFRRLVRALAADEGAVVDLVNQLKGFDSFRVPERKQAE